MEGRDSTDHATVTRRFDLSLFYSFFFVNLPSPNLGLKPPTRTYNPNARGSDACRGSNSLWTRTLNTNTQTHTHTHTHTHTRTDLPECQHNVRASAGDRGQNTDKGHTPNPSTEIKIPDPAGNRRVGRQGLYRPRHGDGSTYHLNINSTRGSSSRNKIVLIVSVSSPVLLTDLLNVVDLVENWNR